MHLRNTRESFGLVSRSLHGLIALILLCQIPIGWYMGGLSDESVVYWRLLELHVVMGLGVFTLIAVKGVWLSVSPHPAPAPALADWERKAARLVHAMLNIAVAMIPLVGFLCIASDGEPVNLYDVVEIPAIGHFSKGVRDALFDLHAWLAYGCAALIAIHILAALKHHFIDRRASLRRIAW